MQRRFESTPDSIVMAYIRACGPCTIGSLIGELIDQCVGVDTEADAERHAHRVVHMLAERSLITIETDEESTYFDWR